MPSKSSTKTNDVEGRRISITVDADTSQRYSRLAWGTKNKLLEATLRMVLDAYDRHGDMLIGAILSGNVRLEQDLSNIQPDDVQNSNGN